MVADGHFDLIREDLPDQRAGKHRRVNLFGVGHQGVAGQRVVMFPAGQCADAADGAVGGAQAGAIALAPDHALVIGGGYLASVLDKRAVGVEQQLSVVDRAAIALVDADTGDEVGFAAGFADLAGDVRGHGDRLFEQLEVLPGHGEGRLHEREIGVVRHHGFRKDSKLHAFAAQLQQLAAEFVDGCLARVEHGTELHGGGANNGHGLIP
ncbi:hypothetical protein D3C76_1132800 [compost metagenome]